jgi:hypothetical protein
LIADADTFFATVKYDLRIFQEWVLS